jgi:hypothetical protein
MDNVVQALIEKRNRINDSAKRMIWVTFQKVWVTFDK